MSSAIAKKESFKIFDDIANKYDFINSVLSFGMHPLWRTKLCARVVGGRPYGLRVLDLATGTGDVALALIKHRQVDEVVGIDLSEGMLAMGREKVKAACAQTKIKLLKGDAMQIGMGGFDAATMSFGIRNVPDPLVCLQQIYASLNPGGRIGILEFGLPKAKWFRHIHLGYLRHVLPHIGKALSGHDFAYRYLNETIETFPYGTAFTDLMKQAGFVETRFEALNMGIVHLYSGTKP